MFFQRKAEPQPIPVPEPPELKPGECECGHQRCSHLAGKARCLGMFPPNTFDGITEWTHCSCQIYIRKEERDPGGDQTPTPTPAELEKLYG